MKTKTQWETLTEFQAFWTLRPELKFLEAARIFQINQNMLFLVEEMKAQADIDSAAKKVWDLGDRRERKFKTIVGGRKS